MKLSSLALVLIATVITSGCANKETKPEVAVAAPAPTTSAPVEPVATSAPPPDCVPAPKSKKKLKKGEKAAAPECLPAAKATATPAPAPAPIVESKPAPAPAPATTAAAPAGKTEAGKPRMMKSKDGTFEGEVFGNIPPGSKWSKLQIGMEQGEVERILGGTHEVRHTPTGKAFIPFYYGTDRYRNEHVYRGQGSVSYTSGGHWGAGRGVLMMINYDPNI